MLFIVYGATLDLGYETREIFRKKGFSIISKYNHVRDDAKVDKKNYENMADSNEWFQKWYDDKVYISEEELEMLDFTYGLDGVCVGFNQKQIVDAVRGVTDSLITLGASSLGFIAELKAAYGDYVTVIHLFEDLLTVEQSVVKYGVFSESEKVTRVAANKKMQKMYLDNKEIFDEIVLYTGEDSVYDLKALDMQYEQIIEKRGEIQKRLNNNKYVSLPYNGADPYIFVSYAHADREEVYKVLYFLQRQTYRIWYDDGITWGANWSKMLKDKIANAECVMLFSSEAAVNSEFVQDELLDAWTNGKQIFNIQLDDARFIPMFEKRLADNQRISIDSYQEKIVSALPMCTRNDKTEM